MQLDQKLKIALGENRLLILGTQVLFGFQFNAIFQDQFAALPYLSRALEASGLTLLMLTIGLLVGPSMEHRIVEGGHDSERVLAVATRFAAVALLPLSAGLAFDIYVAIERALGPGWDVAAAAIFAILALALWYGLAFAVKKQETPMKQQKSAKSTPLAAQVDQLLTEARVILPGAQALLGFQLTVTLTRAFADLPDAFKIAHAAALCCLGLAVILLMAPASLHRIAFGGEDDPQFMNIASVFVIAAPLPLAVAIALDTYVAASRALQSSAVAAVLAAVAICALLGFWYAYPIGRRLAGG